MSTRSIYFNIENSLQTIAFFIHLCFRTLHVPHIEWIFWMLVGVCSKYDGFDGCKLHRGNHSIELLRIKVPPDLFPSKPKLKNERYGTWSPEAMKSLKLITSVRHNFLTFSSIWERMKYYIYSQRCNSLDYIMFVIEPIKWSSHSLARTHIGDFQQTRM